MYAIRSYYVLLLLYFILLLPTVQTGVINYITKQISNKLQTEVSIGHISFRPIKSLVLEDVVVYDQNRDTLFRVKSIETSIKRVSFYNKSLEIGRITSYNVCYTKLLRF